MNVTVHVLVIFMRVVTTVEDKCFSKKECFDLDKLHSYLFAWKHNIFYTPMSTFVTWIGWLSPSEFLCCEYVGNEFLGTIRPYPFLMFMNLLYLLPSPPPPNPLFPINWSLKRLRVWMVRIVMSQGVLAQGYFVATWRRRNKRGINSTWNANHAHVSKRLLNIAFFAWMLSWIVMSKAWKVSWCLVFHKVVVLRKVDLFILWNFVILPSSIKWITSPFIDVPSLR